MLPKTVWHDTHGHQGSQCKIATDELIGWRERRPRRLFLALLKSDPAWLHQTRRCSVCSSIIFGQTLRVCLGAGIHFRIRIRSKNKCSRILRSGDAVRRGCSHIVGSPLGTSKSVTHGTDASSRGPYVGRARSASVLTRYFIVTTIFILLCANALAGLAVGLVFFRAEAIVLASPLVALLSAALLYHQGFGLTYDALILVGSLTALQSSYLAGACMRHWTMDDGQDRWSSGFERSRESAALGDFVWWTRRSSRNHRRS
jgi:hypothetical protein